MAKVLVTGGAGYLGSWCVVRALQRGDEVRATLRDLSRSDDFRAAIAAEVDPGDRLEFVKADLTSDDGWAGAVAGCDYVLHVASPFPAEAPAHEDDLIRPAREGTLRVLRAAVAAGVKRVVVTSSIAAIAYGHAAERYAATAAPMTAADWTEVDGPHVTAYAKSKTLAERAAREFMASEGGATELATVNPSGIFGPPLGRDIGTSMIIVQRLLKGDLPGLPRLGFQIVDVRDTADLHLMAMTVEGAAGGRFVAAGEFMWFADIARTLREEVPDIAGKVPTRQVPDWVLRIYSLIDAQARTIQGELGRYRRVDAAESRAMGWTPRPARQTLAENARALAAIGAI